MKMSPDSKGAKEEEPCRACTDFRSWVKKQKKATSDAHPKRRTDCPPDKEELGRNTWTFLHSLAGYYPVKPDRRQQRSMAHLIDSFAEFYPCKECAEDFKEDIKKNPPNLKSRFELARWFCERHNTVNDKLGKPRFDCNLIDQRWKDGWLDGSCDS